MCMHTHFIYTAIWNSLFSVSCCCFKICHLKNNSMTKIHQKTSSSPSHAEWSVCMVWCQLGQVKFISAIKSITVSSFPAASRTSTFPCNACNTDLVQTWVIGSWARVASLCLRKPLTVSRPPTTCTQSPLHTLHLALWTWFNERIYDCQNCHLSLSLLLIVTAIKHSISTLFTAQL